uniref:Cation-transporting P-type ATPase N-terminal domain-containing protein n=1 Tax=Globisporangium ultimum (strain ATCC 200006 / CBS 805.95 / DAOM BR144) TaxID=431595 RepID=K3WUS5_GLOUD
MAFSYQGSHTPKLPDGELDRDSHRSRFLSEPEKILVDNPAKTRQSYRVLDSVTTQAGWHDQAIEAVLQQLEVDVQSGLTDQEAQRRLAQYGPNALEGDKRAPIWVIFLLQFFNLIIGLLMLAATASIALQEYVEGLAIIAIVTLNAVIATMQENRAGNALEALAKMSSPQCIVVRNGRQVQIASDALVPGDIVMLTTGDIVPADIRLITSSDCKVNEMILTGESEDVYKKFDANMSTSTKLTSDNMVFASTSIACGNATGVVVETAMGTRVGSIAALLRDKKSAEGGNCCSRFLDKYQTKMTPLQEALHHLGVFMGSAVLIICAIVFIVGMVRGNHDPKNADRPVWLTMVMVAVSLAVSAVPEGLPMVVTICLSTGTSDMVKKNVLVRKLAAVESLGAASVICTDKTGTLTEGKMTAIKVWGDFCECMVSGTGFDPTGDFLLNGIKQTPENNTQLHTMLLSAVLCSNTTLQQEKNDDGMLVWTPMGNASEAPLVVAAAKMGIWEADLSPQYPRLTEIPFNSSRKMMITLNQVSNGRLGNLVLPQGVTYVANVKGAPNYILKNCQQYVRKAGDIVDLSNKNRAAILEAVDELSSQALRVLAIAINPLTNLTFAIDSDDIDDKFAQLCTPLIFVGLVASIDPPRHGVKESIKIARAASIRTMMITGDYLKTAVAIAKSIDLLSVGADVDEEAVDCTILRPRGDEYLTDHDLDEITSRTSVFARAKPEDKIEIVKSLQRQGHVAAMTGDGVNDAPALKEADIGVAMGISGTEVAKSASDMILTDDNFCSIVAAVEKGRVIYTNIQKFVCFLLSTNFGEISIIFIAIAVGMPNPLEPLQILVLNLFADGMAAVALSLEKGDPKAMSERPRPKTQQIIHGRLWVLVMTNAFLIGAGALIVFSAGLYWNFQNVLMDDILGSAKTVEDYKSVRCYHWQGVKDHWKTFGNCDALSSTARAFSQYCRVG